MALIPPFFLDCVVSIGVPNGNAVAWIGTGFIVGSLADESVQQPTDQTKKNGYHVFLVTNKHVFEDKKNIILRFNHLHKLSAKDFPIDLQPPGKLIRWLGHSHKDIDVAILPINPNVLEREGINFRFFSLNEHALSVSAMKIEGVSEGDSIFILGFPLGIVSMDSNYNYVISRSGSIARIRDVLEKQQSSFLIDANIFPGNSGGPVVLCPEVVAIEGTKPINQAALLGIVKRYITFSDVAVSQQTKKPRVIFEENSGLAIVETVDSIKDTIDLWLKNHLIGQID
jgi:hypothetical protein